MTVLFILTPGLQVVAHPFTNAELAPDEPTSAERLAASGKLEILQRLLKKLQAAGQRALLLSQDAKVNVQGV